MAPFSPRALLVHGTRLLAMLGMLLVVMTMTPALFQDLKTAKDGTKKESVESGLSVNIRVRRPSLMNYIRSDLQLSGQRAEGRKDYKSGSTVATVDLEDPFSSLFAEPLDHESLEEPSDQSSQAGSNLFEHEQLDLKSPHGRKQQEESEIKHTDQSSAFANIDSFEHTRDNSGVNSILKSDPDLKQQDIEMEALDVAIKALRWKEGEGWHHLKQIYRETRNEIRMLIPFLAIRSRSKTGFSLKVLPFKFGRC